MTVTNVLPSFIPDTLQTLHDEISHSMYNHLPDNVCTVLSHEWFTHFATAIIASVGIILAATTTISFPAIFLSGLFLSGSALIVHTMLLSDANYMQRTGVNPVHMQKTLEIEEQITTFPEGIDENSIDIRDLLTYFDQFESLISIHGEYGVIHPQQARQSLSIFLQNLQERNDFCAVPDGYRDRDEFFDNMIKHLRIITHILSEGNASNYTKNEVFQSLVSASGQCGGRYAGEVINAYQIATETIVAEDVPGKIYEVLHKARNGFIEDVIREHHGNIDDIFHVHAVTTYKKLLGEVRGIRGWSVASYEDPYAQCIGFSTAKAYFDAKYTKSFIINRIFGWLNGIPSDDNPTIRIARDCSNVNEIIDWFKDHIPENFEPEVPITEEMILEEQTSLLMSGELDAVPYERAIESCKKIAFLREFVYDEDAIIIREEAVIYMLRRMEVLV